MVKPSVAALNASERQVSCADLSRQRYLSRMEEGQTYTTALDVIGTHYMVTASPFPVGNEWRFRVTIQPGNIDTVFQYRQEDDHEGLVSATSGMVPHALEYAIGDWIEREDI